MKSRQCFYCSVTPVNKGVLHKIFIVMVILLSNVEKTVHVHSVCEQFVDNLPNPLQAEGEILLIWLVRAVLTQLHIWLKKRSIWLILSAFAWSFQIKNSHKQ